MSVRPALIAVVALATVAAAAASARPVPTDVVAGPICASATVDGIAGHHAVTPPCLNTTLSTLCTYPSVSVGTIATVSGVVCVPGG